MHDIHRVFSDYLDYLDYIIDAMDNMYRNINAMPLVAYTKHAMNIIEEKVRICGFLFWIALVWFICSSIQSHMYHWAHQLQITIYITTYNIWTFTQYNILNNNKKFKDQLEVEFVTTFRYMCIYITIPKS